MIRATFNAGTLALIFSPSASAGAALEPRFLFASNFFVNLHHRLAREASVRQNLLGREPLHGRLATVVRETDALPQTERLVWRRAVETYRRTYAAADRELLFNDELARINTLLATAPSAGTSLPATVPRHVFDALTATAPIFRARFWPASDARNRAWIAALEPLVSAYGRPFRERLPCAYATPWPAIPFRVDVSNDANRYGAYTQTTPNFVHTVAESTDPRLAGFFGLEMLFHEASHAIVGQDAGTVGGTILRVARESGHPEPDQFWHAVIFYSAGAVAQETLRAHGHAYRMYADVNGLFTQAWPTYRAPLATVWQRFLDGDGRFRPTLERCVAMLA